MRERMLLLNAVIVMVVDCLPSVGCREVVPFDVLHEGHLIQSLGVVIQ